MTRLIDNGVDPNVRDYDQRTAFHIAARRGSIKVVDYLVACKAEINAVDRWVLPVELKWRGHVLAASVSSVLLRCNKQKCSIVLRHGLRSVT